MSNIMMCRVCLAQGVRLNVLKEEYQEVFQKLTGVMFITEDGRPDRLCFLCNSLLRRINKFLKTTVHAEFFYDELLCRNMSPEVIPYHTFLHHLALADIDSKTLSQSTLPPHENQAIETEQLIVEGDTVKEEPMDLNTFVEGQQTEQATTSAVYPIIRAVHSAISTSHPSTSAVQLAESPGHVLQVAGIACGGRGGQQTEPAITTSAGKSTASAGEPTASAGEPTASAGEPTASAGKPAASAGEPTASAGKPTVGFDKTGRVQAASVAPCVVVLSRTKETPRDLQPQSELSYGGGEEMHVDTSKLSWAGNKKTTTKNKRKVGKVIKEKYNCQRCEVHFPNESELIKHNITHSSPKVVLQKIILSSRPTNKKKVLQNKRSSLRLASKKSKKMPSMQT